MRVQILSNTRRVEVNTKINTLRRVVVNIKGLTPEINLKYPNISATMDKLTKEENNESLENEVQASLPDNMTVGKVTNITFQNSSLAIQKDLDKLRLEVEPSFREAAVVMGTFATLSIKIDFAPQEFDAYFNVISSQFPTTKLPNLSTIFGSHQHKYLIIDEMIGFDIDITLKPTPAAIAQDPVKSLAAAPLLGDSKQDVTAPAVNQSQSPIKPPAPEKVTAPAVDLKQDAIPAINPSQLHVKPLTPAITAASQNPINALPPQEDSKPAVTLPTTKYRCGLFSSLKRIMGAMLPSLLGEDNKENLATISPAKK
jgi:hypothetical protein